VRYKEWNYRTFAEGATYMRPGGHHVGHRPTFLKYRLYRSLQWQLGGARISATPTSHCKLLTSVLRQLLRYLLLPATPIKSFSLRRRNCARLAGGGISNQRQFIICVDGKLVACILNRFTRACVFMRVLKAKFHYAIAGSEPAPN